jgi:CheY-like chemotaxis protein
MQERDGMSSSTVRFVHRPILDDNDAGGDSPGTRNPGTADRPERDPILCRHIQAGKKRMAGCSLFKVFQCQESRGRWWPETGSAALVAKGLTMEDLDPSKRTILAVDDDPSVRAYVRGTLERQGFQVVTAGAGVEALEYLRAGTADLVLLDIQMPEMSGFEVLDRLRDNRRTESLPVMFLTVEDSRVQEADGLRAGVIDYISKDILRQDRVDILIYKIRNFFAWQENERLRGAIATMIAANHEINNSLMVIQGSTDVMRIGKQVEDDSEEAALLGRIVESGKDISEVLERISSIERWETTAYIEGVEMLDLESVAG